MKNSIFLIFFCIFSCFSKFSTGQNDFPDCDPKCVFQIGNLTSKSIGSFPKKCSKVCSKIYIDETAKLSAEQLKYVFKDMKTLKGRLEIVHTSYKNLNFLAGLQAIEANTSSVTISGNPGLEELGLTNLTSINGTFFVTFNAKLKRLKLPNLKNAQLHSPYSFTPAVSFGSNSPKFCMTLQEAKIFLNFRKINSFMFDSKVCKPGNPTKKICVAPKIGCENLVGDLKIGPKFDFKKVKSLKFLYGSLIVKNSNLTDFKVFENLLEIVQLNTTKLAIDVQDNKKLQSAMFPKLQRIYTDHMIGASFKNNHNSLKFDFNACFSIRNVVGGQYNHFSTRFDDLSCEDMERLKKPNGGK
ncbi:Protein CBG13829 [Caenorhabditis briggsae]|uniref:Protein CBG13829 n=1 Tax=Caenorhabditis briggsae TaxID=6238 RepID=A8XIS9_CAEBR|nr:Protein CBG13829 [Caenorhabditis briggsae]CAP32554.1 Protein CBG13829 [Caenorhabditis briggsae]